LISVSLVPSVGLLGGVVPLVLLQAIITLLPE
jgi:hypothetical protein